MASLGRAIAGNHRFQHEGVAGGNRAPLGPVNARAGGEAEESASSAEVRSRSLARLSAWEKPGQRPLFPRGKKERDDEKAGPAVGGFRRERAAPFPGACCCASTSGGCAKGSSTKEILGS